MVKYKSSDLHSVIKNARDKSLGGDGENLTIQSLILALASNKEDQEKYEIIIDELQQKDSQLHQQLSKAPFSQHGKVSFQALAVWCLSVSMDDPEHEAGILWEILQDDANGEHPHHEIAAHDKDLKPSFYVLLKIALLLPVKAVGSQVIAKKVRKKFRAIYEDFLDEIFEYSSKLTRQEFETLVKLKYPQLFNSQKLRRKMFDMED
jgi:hypothetical protein